MALLNDILKWTESLALWQRDAMRLLFQQEGELTDEQFQDVYDLFKVENDVMEDNAKQAIPFSNEHFSATIQEGANFSLNCVKDLQDVNRIASNQILNFAPTGLTAVYGDNGSGKSGYGRVMKMACRARDQNEQIFPDANDADAANRTPKAAFVVTTDNREETHIWEQGAAAPECLSKISVFDANCARAYVTKKQEVAYLPYGLDTVENLANLLMPKLSELLENEINAIDTDVRAFEGLKGETEVGRIFAQLTRQSDVEAIKQLGEFADTDSLRLTEIAALLAEANPLQRAAEIRTSAKRIKNIAEKLDRPLLWVKDSAVAKFQSFYNEKVSAEAAEKIVSDSLSSDEQLLPATGDDAWRILFDAARQYSVVATPANEFPDQTPDSKCMLCQEPLPEHALARLKRFDDYVLSDVSKTADVAREALQGAVAKITNANLVVTLDQTETEELEQGLTGLSEVVATYQSSLAARKSWMLNAIETGDWDILPEISESPRLAIRRIAAIQFRSARALARTADQATRRQLELESNQLTARKALSEVLQPALDLVERLKAKAALEACKPKLNTRSVSLQSKRFASAAVTDGLSQALDEEFKNLGMKHIKTELRESTVQGQLYHQLMLAVPGAQKLEKILSEGEQRAIAIGSFLAELSLANHTCGIIFDDPVSSLDHTKRRYVARRLVQEAQTRQVMIFTHEAVFLEQLKSECEHQSVDFCSSHLHWQSGKCGVIKEGLPWPHQGVNERVQQLNAKHQEFVSRPWPDNPSFEEQGEVAHVYDELRATIERLVQDNLLGGTVKRFNEYISMRGLQAVVGLQQSEVDEVKRLMQICHDRITGHDPASAMNEPGPTPDELREHLDDLVALKQAIADRRSI